MSKGNARAQAAYRRLAKSACEAYTNGARARGQRHPAFFVVPAKALVDFDYGEEMPGAWVQCWVFVRTLKDERQAEASIKAKVDTK